MHNLFKALCAGLCLILFISPLVSSNVAVITQGLPATKGFHLSFGTLPSSNIIFVSTGEIDAYDGVWVNPDTEIEWYYIVKTGNVYLLGINCYTPSYPFCPELNLNLSKNLAHFKTVAELARGVPSNGYLIFNFGKSSYEVPISEILPYLWDESWIGNMWGYKINNTLIFFPKVIIEIKGYSVRYQNCFVENSSVAVISLDQSYNVTYYVKDSWKRSRIGSRILNQRELRHLLAKPFYIFIYNGTFRALRVGRINFEYFTASVNSSNSTLVFVRPQFYYSNLAPIKIGVTNTNSGEIGGNTSPSWSGGVFWCPTALIIIITVIFVVVALEYKNNKKRE